MAAKKNAPSKDSTTAAAVAAVKSAASRKARRSRMIIWGSVAAAVFALVVATVIIVGNAARHKDEVDASADGSIEGVEVIAGLTANHVANLPEPEAVDGERLPPVGGDHDEAWQTCAVYDAPVGSWHAVHSMEHGAVWVTYNPELSADDVAVLASLVEGNDYALLSPFPDLADPVVVSAWGLRLELDSVTDPRIEVFIAKYSAGPQTPEPGAPCLGGIDATL